MSDSTLSTALHRWHIDNGGRMVDFAGWQMPIQYTSILDEHHATRNQATLFDVSHMGRVNLSGSDAESFIDSLTTRKVAGMAAGRIRYSLVCNETGGILDDILVYRIPDSTDQWMLVVNASNREKILGWIESKKGNAQVEVVDRTVETAMIAFQGPLAVEVANRFLDFDLSELKYFTFRRASFGQAEAWVSRTGYTGEDGCEIIVENEYAEKIWQSLVDENGVSAAGLGARDTLRLESAMPLYGHELSENVNAAQTDLGFAISMKDREFCGKSEIQNGMEDTALPVRIGLLLEGKRAAREGAEIYDADLRVGVVTSGTFSPTLQRPIAMGYVNRDYADIGKSLLVDIRGKSASAEVCELPFYKR